MGPYLREAELQNNSYAVFLPFTEDKKAEENPAFLMTMKKIIIGIHLGNSFFVTW